MMHFINRDLPQSYTWTSKTHYFLETTLIPTYKQYQKNQSWMTSLYPVKEQVEWNLGPPAGSRNFLNYFNVYSVSLLVSHDYFPGLRAPATLPCNCICNSRQPGRIKMRSMFSPTHSNTSGSSAFCVRSLNEDLLFNVELSLNIGSVRQKTNQARTKTSTVRFQSQLVRGPGTGWKSALAVQATGPTIKADISTYTSAHSSGAGTMRGTSGLSLDKCFS